MYNVSVNGLSSKAINKKEENKMYNDDENLATALSVLDAIFEDIIKQSVPTSKKNGCTCHCRSRSPLSGQPQMATHTIEVPCSCKTDMNFSDIMDDIENVIFNEPATIVTFKDGSKVCVKACEKDTFSKETGLMYALVKRLYANDIDENGYLKSRGLGEKITKVINNAYDQKKAETKRRAERKAKKAAKEAAQKEADAKANLADEVSEKAAQEAVNQVYSQTPNEQK